MSFGYSFRGSALVLVLWLVAALSLVVVAGAKGIRQQTSGIGELLGGIRAEMRLDGAIQLVAQRMLNAPDPQKGYRWMSVQVDEEEVWVEMTPSEGLVDVSVASEALLQALFRGAAGMSPGDAAVLASRIKDWIDPDDEPSGVGGAEAPQYRAEAWPSLPRNAPPEDFSELRSVMGFTPELYETIAPFLGLNGQQRIQVDSAPPELIDVLSGQSGLGAKVHAASPEQRAALLLSMETSQLFAPGAGAGLRDVRLRAFIATGEDRWWQREAWISLSPRPDTLTPWTTLLLEPVKRGLRPNKEFKP